LRELQKLLDQLSHAGTLLATHDRAGRPADPKELTAVAPVFLLFLMLDGASADAEGLVDV
jgi:hypothetical protein